MIAYELWDLRDELTVEEAAHLWFEIDPNESNIPPQIQVKIAAIFKVLEEARQNGKIEQTTPTGPHAWMAMPFIPKLSREGLRNYANKIGQKPVFLFPEERKTCKVQHISKQSEEVFTHSEDYRSVTLRSKNYALTSKQASAIKVLHEAFLEGHPDITENHILEKIKSGSYKLRDIFKSKDDRKTKSDLIVQGKRKGLLRLNIEGEESS